MRSLGQVGRADGRPARTGGQGGADQGRGTAKHGQHNTFYLHNASCTFGLTNDDNVGMLEFRFEGTVLTDAEDRKAQRCDLQVELARETCDWLTEPVVAWFTETVKEAVLVEFDRYIAAGDLDQAVARMQKLEAESDAWAFWGWGFNLPVRSPREGACPWRPAR